MHYCLARRMFSFNHVSHGIVRAMGQMLVYYQKCKNFIISFLAEAFMGKLRTLKSKKVFFQLKLA
jgi:hypothetical protein